MERMKRYLQNPKQRRQALSIVSGLLIAVALAAGNIFHWTVIGNVLMAAAALVAGWDIALRALRSLRNRHVSIELLVTIAAAGALLIGEYWEAAAVTFLFVFGAYLEARTLSRTRQVLAELLDTAPAMAVVLRGGRQVEVSPQEVGEGETVLVKPGAKLPVDGVVLEGHSLVDESAITGEPVPEEKTSGEEVFAGTVNGNGLLTVQATGVGADTTLARIIRRVEEAQEEKAPTQRFIERFARWYTPAIIALSGLTFLISRDIELALTLLVIGCPGALVISTPVSIVAGIGRAAQLGILMKGGEYLENAGKISALALDKTGTLTRGKPALTDIIALETEREFAVAGSSIANTSESMASGELVLDGGQPVSGREWSTAQRQVLYWAAVAEAGSQHPLAQPVLTEAEAWLQEDGSTIPQAQSFESFTGKGVLAEYAGSRIAVGSLALAEALEVAVPQEAGQALDRLQSEGKTAVLVIKDGAVLGVLGIADTLRDTATEAIQRIQQAGVRRIVMLTGDDPETAQAIARQVGLQEVRAGLLPEDKLDAIRELQAEGHVVAMAGDGINDAPALAAADVGIAMGAAGTDVAIETADIALMADDLLKLPEAIHLSKATLSNIRQNVVIALATVGLLLAGVLLGEVHMAGGMLVHEASVLVVIFNGMRLLRA